MSIVNAGLACPSRSDTTFHGHTGFDQQGPVGVADVVESHSGHVGLGDDPVEGLRERMGAYRLTFFVGEHPACRFDSGVGLFGLPPIPPGGENPQRWWGEVDAPPCDDRLASCLGIRPRVGTM